MSDPVLQVKQVSVMVGRKSLLSDVSIQVEQGRHLALIGANGAGKSSLIKAILGISAPPCKVTGEVSISNRNLASLSRKEIAQTVAYVPQLLAMEIPYSVREFIAMGRYAHESKPDDVVDRVMKTVGVSGFAERTVSTLSGGERQRVCIAAALAQEAPIILLDEPLVHLDPGQRLEVQRSLRAIGKEVTMIIVTHDIRWVNQDFDHVVALQKGKVVFDGDHEGIEREGVYQKLFGENLTEEGMR